MVSRESLGGGGLLLDLLGELVDWSRLLVGFEEGMRFWVSEDIVRDCRVGPFFWFRPQDDG